VRSALPACYGPLLPQTQTRFLFKAPTEEDVEIFHLAPVTNYGEGTKEGEIRRLDVVGFTELVLDPRRQVPSLT